MKAGKEIIDAKPVEGVFFAIAYAKQQILEELIRAKVVRKTTTVDDIKWVPLIGHKNTEHLKNLGMVIGYEAVLIDARGETREVRLGYSLRVDYDDIKGAHINYGCNLPNSTFVRAVKVEIPAPERFFRNAEESMQYAMECLTRRHIHSPEVYDQVRVVRDLMIHDNVNSFFVMHLKPEPKITVENTFMANNNNNQ